ncbi:MAG TPA: 3-hydroxyacyl-CoA dehydrogenase family protein [Candidatus Angelobacter sp.]|nr:3-hydroxyacyl-CoA dehydrogenase family protein [Candidatus Angelobacter sp.]
MGEIRTVAVIGAGALGRGIAHAAALAGYRTILEDILPTKLRTAEAELRGKAEAEAVLAHMEYAPTVEEAARQADLVIEAVPDELESKIEIFTLLDKLCKPDTILATNTTTLSVTEIASVTYRWKKCIGMRFTDPVDRMTTLELVRGQETDDEAVAACSEVGMRMGKKIIVSTDR